MFGFRRVRLVSSGWLSWSFSLWTRRWLFLAAAAVAVALTESTRPLQRSHHMISEYPAELPALHWEKRTRAMPISPPSIPRRTRTHGSVMSMAGVVGPTGASFWRQKRPFVRPPTRRGGHQEGRCWGCVGMAESKWEEIGGDDKSLSARGCYQYGQSRCRYPKMAHHEAF